MQHGCSDVGCRKLQQLWLLVLLLVLPRLLLLLLLLLPVLLLPVLLFILLQLVLLLLLLLLLVVLQNLLLLLLLLLLVLVLYQPLVDEVHAADQVQVLCTHQQHVSSSKTRITRCCKDTARPDPGQCCHPAAAELCFVQQQGQCNDVCCSLEGLHNGVLQQDTGREKAQKGST
jgi:hypothetical protein